MHERKWCTGKTSANIPEGDEDDAVDDIQLFQNACHARGSELENKETTLPQQHD